MNSQMVVLVISKHYFPAMGIIRALGTAGCIVDLLSCPSKVWGYDVIAASRYIRTIVRVPDDESAPSCLFDYVARNKTNTYLFPIDDFSVEIVSRFSNELPPYVFFPKVSSSVNYTLAQLMDKSIQHQLAVGSGLNVADERILNMWEDYCIEDIHYPCFCKPLSSISGQKSELHKCDNADELLSYLEERGKRDRNRSILVQEYLNIDCEYTIPGIAIDQDLYFPVVIQKKRVSSFTKGVTLQGETKPLSVLGEALGSVQSFLQSLHYEGTFDLELFNCGGTIYFNELNLRPSAANFAVTKVGVNLPAILMDYYCTSKSIDRGGVDTVPSTIFVNNKVAVADCLAGSISKRECNSIFRHSDYTLLEDKADPNPEAVFQHYQRRVLRFHETKKFVRKIIKRK